MSVETWIKRIKKWVSEGLKSESFSPDKIALQEVPDAPNKFIFKHTELPYNLMITIDDNFLSIVGYTGVETATMSREDRLNIYRKMLIANDEMKLVKFVLSGRDDEVTVRTDLDLATLGKVEFFDALVSVIIGMERIRRIMKGDEDTDEDEELKRTLVILIKELGKERVIGMLMEKGGLKREEAEALVEGLIKEYKLEPPGQMYG